MSNAPAPESKLLSQRAYAKLRGVSHVAVGNAVREGRIKLVDGKIDPGQADKDWKSNTRINLSNQKAKAKKARTAGKPGPAPADAVEPDPVEAALRRSLGRDVKTNQPLHAQAHGGAIKGEKDDVAFTPAAFALARGDQPADNLTMVDAQLAHELIKIDERRTKAGQLKGRFIDRVSANNRFFEVARQFRDAWLNWVVTTGPLMAAQLSEKLGVEVDVHLVTVTLEAHVRDQLALSAGVSLDGDTTAVN